MSRVTRTDFAALPPLRKAELTQDGFLRAEGRPARVGVQIYHNTDGTVRRELRLPEEVQKSVEQFGGVPLTNDHPPDARVTSDNAKLHVIGAVGAARYVDGWIIAPLTIHDGDAIKSARRGRAQLSCGYSATIEKVDSPDPALVAQFGAYSHLQRDIQINHVALVDQARAGNEARLRLDGQSYIDDTNELSEEEQVNESNIETKTDEVPDELAQLRAELERARGQIAALEASEKNRADSIEKLKIDSEQRLADRLALVQQIWSAGYSVDAQQFRNKSDAALKRAMIRRWDSSIVLDGKSDDFCTGTFQTLLKQQQARTAGFRARDQRDQGAALFIEDDANDSDIFAPSIDPESAYAKMNARSAAVNQAVQSAPRERTDVEEFRNIDPSTSGEQAYQRMNRRNSSNKISEQERQALIASMRADYQAMKAAKKRGK